MLDVRPSPRTRRRFGFTLIELLLVVAITLLASSLAIPSFIRSYRGAKLRTAVRTIVMGHRYTRSMAVLEQKYMAVYFDTTRNEMEVVSVAASSLSQDRDDFLNERSARVLATEEEIKEKAEDASKEAEAPPPAVITPELMRPMPDGVKILSVECDKPDQVREGVYWVNYFPNGMCDPYKLQVEDERHKIATLDVDPMSGSVEVKYE